MVQLVLANVRGQNASQVAWNIVVQLCVELSHDLTDDADGETEEDGEEADHLGGVRAPVHMVLDGAEDGNQSELQS